MCHTQTHEDHLKGARGVLQTPSENITLNCQWRNPALDPKETEYLGFKLTDNGILPGTDKTKAVREFPPPKTVRQIRQFVGLASFFRDHIRDFSRISGHLTALTKKDNEWKGGELPPKCL